MANHLAGETSPYLLQHQTNPVNWRPWGAEALALARAEGKPILLSIGYAACHWCHVMAHESFEDEAIAALMNQLFIAIKVDREERPDIDLIYQNALVLLGQQGGWPLTMFLKPTGEPFWGGTYFPPAPRWGRPSFTDVLRMVSEIYRNEPDKVEGNVAALGAALARLAHPRAGAPVTHALLDQAAARLLSELDPINGGIGEAPKFPQMPIFELMWRAYKRTGKKAYRTAVDLTLSAMAQGGIYDHLGGGFARYSVDERWLVPHFEKMLYDNAQIVDLMTLVWQETQNPLYAARVVETIEWTLREMVAEGGGFASSLDADSEGEEGKFYVWTKDEIDAVLGTDAGPFDAAYDVTTEGNWEGRVILNRSQDPTLKRAAQEAALAVSRARLLDVRSRRARPGWDDKVLADWNGMMIAAMARAAAVFDKPAWAEAALRAYAFVRDRMSEGERLRHSARGGRAHTPGTLDDYAHMARAALALHETRGDARFLEHARAWVRMAVRHHGDPDVGGFFMTADDTDALIVRSKNAGDHATPSGNGTMVEVLARLYLLTGEESYRIAAQATITAFSGELARGYFSFASLLNGAETLETALQVVLVGRAGSDDLGALLGAVRRRSHPNMVLQVVAPGAALPRQHPAAGKTMAGERALAYVCRGATCSLPIHDPAGLAKALG